MALGDRGRAARLYEDLSEVSRAEPLMVGMTICFGPGDRLLGNLAALLGRDHDAEDHFLVALRAPARRSQSPVWRADACSTTAPGS